MNMKFNSQVCTSVEESKKLLALGIKPETADMVHIKELAYDEENHCTYDADTYFIRPIDYLEGEKHRSHIPAWSLHRLMKLYSTTVMEGDVTVLPYNDTYDSIIESIEWAINNRYFNKEYLKGGKK